MVNIVAASEGIAKMLPAEADVGLLPLLLQAIEIRSSSLLLIPSLAACARITWALLTGIHFHFGAHPCS